jgi:putative salt-induced outer membrane protein
VIPAFTNGEAIARGAVNYEQKLTATTSAFDKFLVEAGSDNTYLQNELGIAVKMTDMLALSVAYLVRHNTDVNESADPVPEKTDQLITVNLVFAF